MLRWYEYAQIYHPTREWIAAPDELGRPFENMSLIAADGVKLSAWYFGPQQGSPRHDHSFLVCHGNGGNISHRLELTRLLLGTGAGVLLFDYRGYGHSEGKLSEEGTYRDAQAAHAWLRERGFNRIVAFGESLGGAVAAELALREPLAGLILQSTFTSIADVGEELLPWLPVRLLNTIKYDTRSKLPRIKVPVLVLHGRNDSLVRFHHAERNFAAANEPKLFRELSGDHNDSLLSDHDTYSKCLEEFLALVESASLRDRADVT